LSEDRPSVDELVEVIKSDPNSRVAIERKEGVPYRIRIVAGGRTYRIGYDESVYNKLKEAESEARSRKESGSKGPQQVTSDIGIWTTYIRGKRPLVEQLVEKLAWLQGALIDIGANAFLAVMLASGEDPDRISERLGSLNDKETLVNYVTDKLLTFISAAKDVSTISSLKERVAALEVQNALLTESLEKLKLYAGDLRRKLDIALSIMGSSELRRYAKVLMMESLGRVIQERVVSGEGKEVGGEGGE